MFHLLRGPGCRCFHVDKFCKRLLDGGDRVGDGERLDRRSGLDFRCVAGGWSGRAAPSRARRSAPGPPVGVGHRDAHQRAVLHEPHAEVGRRGRRRCRRRGARLRAFCYRRTSRLQQPSRRSRGGSRRRPVRAGPSGGARWHGARDTGTGGMSANGASSSVSFWSSGVICVVIGSPPATGRCALARGACGWPPASGLSSRRARERRTRARSGSTTSAWFSRTEHAVQRLHQRVDGERGPLVQRLAHGAGALQRPPHPARAAQRAERPVAGDAEQPRLRVDEPHRDRSARARRRGTSPAAGPRRGRGRRTTWTRNWPSRRSCCPNSRSM